MADQSAIEWTDATWNPVTGCDKVSTGCKNCYAERLAPRLRAMGNRRYRNGFQVTLHHDLLNLPSGWRRPRRVFVNSMSDLFHDRVPLGFIQKVHDTIEQCPQHTFQILTKRPERALKCASSLPWPPNLWMGTSVENAACTHRIDTLRLIPAQVRFLSLEPLLGPLDDLDLQGIHWVITGGESGPGARAVNPSWVERIRDQCLTADVPFFFKQWGGVNRKQTGRTMDGRTWDEFPNRAGPAGPP